MKANELTIGDWVKLKGDYGKPLQIITIDDTYNSINYFDGDAEGELTLQLTEIEPIPLTAEILEKNGFGDIGDETWQLEEKPYWFWVDFINHQYGCEFDTSTYENEDDEHRLKLYGIPAIHELQHAMKLCGIEKQIEL